MKNDNLEKARERLNLKSAEFTKTFTSPAGKKVLEALEEEFDGVDLRQSTPHDTYYKLGQRDVVVYIKQMLDLAKRNES